MSIVAGYTSSEEEDVLTNIVKLAESDLVVPVNRDGDDPGKDDMQSISHSAVQPKQYFGGTAEKVYYDEGVLKLNARMEKRTRAPRKANSNKKRQKGNVEDDYLGPWAEFESESEESTKVRKTENVESDNDRSISTKDSSEDEGNVEQENDITTKFFGNEADIKDVNFMQIPENLNIDLTKDPGARKCSAPRRIFHTFDGHAGGVNKLEFFPRSGHLLLSCGNDSNIHLWSLYHDRKLLRAYYGHHMAVKDITFNSNGTQFLSCSYDRQVILWNTARGSIEKRLRTKAVPNTIKFNPLKETEIIVGLSNHKIEHYDFDAPEYTLPIQVYDHHIGAINALIIIDEGRKFISTADDRSVRLWEWKVNIPLKVMADPSQYAMPTAALHPDEKFLVLQCMDNSVVTMQLFGKFKFGKQTFKGHHSAGFGIQVDFSQDGKILMSGSTRGSAYFWDWKSREIIKKMKVSDKVITCIRAHPQESSKVSLAGLSGKIFYCE